MERRDILGGRSIALLRTITAPRSASSALRPIRWVRPGLVALGAAIALASTATPREARAQDSATSESAAVFDGSKVCAQSTAAAQKACKAQTEADYALAVGGCNNDTNESTRQTCLSQAKDDLASAKDDCKAQLQSRQSVCQQVGPGAYDPPIDPANFTTSITNSFSPFPPGKTWIYNIINKGDTNPSQIDTVHVTGKTITIMSVTCMVVHDYQNDTKTHELVEDTYDYYAQDKQGNVWYFGEASAQYANGYIVGNEGSWIGGVNGAKPGIIMQGAPTAGQSYRQEYQLGVAEDAASVVSLGGSLTVPYGSFSNVLKTKEYSGLEPDADENKFYAPGVGNLLTIDNVTGEQDPLVSVTNEKP